jgi:hypothetical protein
MLGVGLHSYGFMEGGFWWLLLFASSQLFLLANGLTPINCWRSFASAADVTGRNVRLILVPVNAIALLLGLASAFALQTHSKWGTIGTIACAVLTAVVWLPLIVLYAYRLLQYLFGDRSGTSTKPPPWIAADPRAAG